MSAAAEGVLDTPILDKAAGHELTAREVVEGIKELRRITPESMVRPFEVRMSWSSATLLAGNGAPLVTAPTAEDALCDYRALIRAEIAGAA